MREIALSTINKSKDHSFSAINSQGSSVSLCYPVVGIQPFPAIAFQLSSSSHQSPAIMVFNEYTKRLIVFYHQQGLNPGMISRALSQEEGIKGSRRGIARFILHYRTSGSIDRKAGSGRPSTVTPEVKTFIEEAMHKDDETTAKQLHHQPTSRGYKPVQNNHPAIALGWTF